MNTFNRFEAGGQSRRWFLKAMAVLVASRIGKAASPAKGEFSLGRLGDSGARIISLDPRFDRLVDKVYLIPTRVPRVATWRATLFKARSTSVSISVSIRCSRLRLVWFRVVF